MSASETAEGRLAKEARLVHDWHVQRLIELLPMLELQQAELDADFVDPHLLEDFLRSHPGCPPLVALEIIR